MILFLGILAGSILFAVLCKRPLRRFPWIFYLLALAFSALLLLSYWVSFPRTFQMFVILPQERCSFALAFFIIVMFIGVFKDDSRLKGYFMPVRAELSIMACIFALPHIVRNLTAHLPKLFNDAFGITLPVSAAILLGLVLTALMLLLGITSFKAIKEKMHRDTWKRIQRLAYFFFGIIYLHLTLMLLPSALNGGVGAAQNFIVYSTLFVLYVVARTRRAFIDKNEAV
ncbi:MAG: hypothetical protein LBP91_01535 [Coriobacteriales bacterium]|jgi:DMSO/TMAO reductase YedYZ heme-binding membrane subunit|nr:hypothetical protein [Coriobacteriales bacterium]